MMIMDFLQVLGVISALVGLLFGVRVLGRRYHWHPEWQRKTLHVALGSTALSFPWLFDSRWPVFTICGVGALILLALRTVPALRRQLGKSLHDVNRSSIGELLFALAIALLFALTAQAPLSYLIPLAILTLADTAAALVGAQWGQHHFAVPDGHKSWEGTVAFALTAAAVTGALLAGLTTLPWPALILTALTLALLTTLLEALAWQGLDNLLVPLGAYLALTLLLAQPVGFLLYQLTIFCSLAILLEVLPRRLQPHTKLTALVMAYALWSGGPLLWLMLLLALLWATLLVRKPWAEQALRQLLETVPAYYWLAVAGR
jgi:phytol kinase